MVMLTLMMTTVMMVVMHSKTRIAFKKVIMVMAFNTISLP